MPANRDKNQKYGFFYQNLYKLYKNTKNAEAEAVRDIVRDEANLESLHDVGPVVLKVGERAAAAMAAAAPAIAPDAQPEFRADPTFESLRDNLKRLSELHKKLKFMLEELEDLSKKE